MRIPWETNINLFSFKNILNEGEYKMIGIYKIENLNDGKIYIGQSNNIERRFYEHMTKGTTSRIPLDIAIEKEGAESFSYQIVELCPIEQLNQRETFWIKFFRSNIYGYNKNQGGMSNVIGNNNPKAKLTEKDVIRIRQAYAKHERQKDVYKEFENKISFGYFQNLWQGKSWSHIMPEVFTKENKQYYIYQNSQGSNGVSAQFTDEEVIQLRHRYVNETAKKIYEDYKDRVSYQTFQAILWGRSYSTLPIYKKKEKKWINI